MLHSTSLGYFFFFRVNSPFLVQDSTTLIPTPLEYPSYSKHKCLENELMKLQFLYFDNKSCRPKYPPPKCILRMIRPQPFFSVWIKRDLYTSHIYFPRDKFSSSQCNTHFPCTRQPHERSCFYPATASWIQSKVCKKTGFKDTASFFTTDTHSHSYLACWSYLLITS